MAESKEEKVVEKEEKKPKKVEKGAAFRASKLKAINEMPNRALAEALAKRVLRNSKED